MSLGLICRKGLGSTLKALGIVDHYWEIEKGNSKSYSVVLDQIEKYDINLLISAHTSFRTALFCRKVKAKRKISFIKSWNFFAFDERVLWPKDFPESLRLLTLIKSHSRELRRLFHELPKPLSFVEKRMGGKLLPPPLWADLNQSWKPQDASHLMERFNLSGKNCVALFPGSVWATKMWKKEGYVQLGSQLQIMGYQIIIMGGPDEVELGLEVANSIPHAINICGKTSLLESLILLSQVSLVVGNDSSSSHMAALVNAPIVTIFGPTVLKFGYRPWANKSAAVELEGLDCRPCSSHGPQKCPLGHHNCMRKLEATDVMRVVEGMLTTIK